MKAKLKKFKRVTVARVRRARKLTGSKPVRFHYTARGGRSCALTCVAWVEGDTSIRDKIEIGDEFRALVKHFCEGGVRPQSRPCGSEYLIGFIEGYDTESDPGDPGTLWRQGFNDGKRVRKAGL